MSKLFNEYEILMSLINNMKKQVWELSDKMDSLNNLISKVNIYDNNDNDNNNNNNNNINKGLVNLYSSNIILSEGICDIYNTVKLRNNVYNFFRAKYYDNLDNLKYILSNISIKKEGWDNIDNKLADITISVFGIQFNYSYWGSEGEFGTFNILLNEKVILEKDDHIYNLDINDIKEEVIKILIFCKNINRDLDGNMIIDIIKYIIDDYIYEDKMGFDNM